MPFQLTGVGHVSLDHCFNVAQAPAAGQKTPARRYHQQVGGMTANALVAAARLGAQAALYSPVGDDASAALFVQHLAREGVASHGLRRVAAAHSSVSAVAVDAQGGRTIINHRGDALLRCGPFDAAWLAGADAVLVDPRCVAWAEAALQAARLQQRRCVFDGDTAPVEDLRRLVPWADWAVFSESGLMTWHAGQAWVPPGTLHSAQEHTAALAAALAAGAQVAVVTLGEQGLLWQRAGMAVQRLPAAPVQHLGNVVDTTAAGDVFHGALALALAEQQADLQALRFASAAAALKCLRPDGVCGAPGRAEVQALLDTFPVFPAAHGLPAG
jgi:sulfofructose kinase